MFALKVYNLVLGSSPLNCISITLSSIYLADHESNPATMICRVWVDISPLQYDLQTPSCPLERANDSGVSLFSLDMEVQIPSRSKADSTPIMPVPRLPREWRWAILGVRSVGISTPLFRKHIYNLFTPSPSCLARIHAPNKMDYINIPFPDL